VIRLAAVKRREAEDIEETKGLGQLAVAVEERRYLTIEIR
jgi:hypothetical protein